MFANVDSHTERSGRNEVCSMININESSKAYIEASNLVCELFNELIERTKIFEAAASEVYKRKLPLNKSYLSIGIHAALFKDIICPIVRFKSNIRHYLIYSVY